MKMRRLSPQPREWIDRDRPIRFYFEGSPYEGFAGDTLTSALAANGVSLLGRSFKYHRPRGIYSLANHDVNALVEDARRTNLRGDILPIEPDARFTAANTFGGLAHDRAHLIDRCAALLPVGFYYKTFHRPRRLFPFFERRMRRLAGLGAINANLPRERTPKRYDFCEVLVVGAGAAGLAAALAAAEAGADVLLVDEQPRIGGSLGYRWDSNGEAERVAAELRTRLAALPNIRTHVATLAAACYRDRWVALVDETRLTKLRAGSIVLATGCYEQPAVFGNNDLPGVMLGSAAQRLIHSFAVRPCDRAVVLAANSDGYRVALDLKQAGSEVAAIVDLRPACESTGVADQAVREGIRVLPSHCIYEALPCTDRSGSAKAALRGVLVCPLGNDGAPRVKQASEIACDGLLMSVGYAPTDGLFYQSGGRMGWSEELAQFVPHAAPEGIFVAGRVNAVYGLADKVADGRRAGMAAACYVGRQTPAIAPEPPRPAVSPNHPYPIVPHPRAKCFVDLDEDVHYKDIVNAVQEGFDQVELLKRYSTFGMGPTQGKLANTNAVRILAKIKGQSVAETGVPRSRPFVHPVPLSHLAGRGFHPHRRTPLDAWHARASAVFIPAGDWRRPAYYAAENQARDEVIAAEVLAVRQSVGLIDIGTLGKLELNGPDAAAFLERVYTGNFAGMPVGTLRYALACDDSGVVIDDGIVARLAENRFYVTASTTASAAVYREMQRFAIIWGTDVVLANVTGARVAVNVAGPQARRVLQQLTDIDCSQASFPYSAVRAGTVAGVSARVMRVGFVGELGYEIHMPAHSACRLWEELLSAGQSYGIRPFGVEAQRVLRLEKGHLIVGQDSDGLSNPYELNLHALVKSKKPFFVGSRSLEIVRRKPLVRQLVGFQLEAKASQGEHAVRDCHLIVLRGDIVGRVTSVAASPTLRQTIGLAHVRPELAAAGTQLSVRVDSGPLVSARVVPTPFYDPQGARQTQSNQGT
jgi:sarcosine oxidase subunit alpha